VIFSGRIFITDNYLGGFFFPVQAWSDPLYGVPFYADLNFGNS
jgi:hypothetical protein